MSLSPLEPQRPGSTIGEAAAGRCTAGRRRRGPRSAIRSRGSGTSPSRLDGDADRSRRHDAPEVPESRDQVARGGRRRLGAGLRALPAGRWSGPVRSGAVRSGAARSAGSSRRGQLAHAGTAAAGGPAVGSARVGAPPGELARRIGRGKVSQQPTCFTILLLAEARERIERQTDVRLPERVVSVLDSPGYCSRWPDRRRHGGRELPSARAEGRASRTTAPDGRPARARRASASTAGQLRGAGDAARDQRQSRGDESESPWFDRVSSTARRPLRSTLSTSTSRALPPAAGETRPSISIMSTSRAARLKPMRSLRCRYEIDACPL